MNDTVGSWAQRFHSKQPDILQHWNYTERLVYGRLKEIGWNFHFQTRNWQRFGYFWGENSVIGESCF